MKMINTKQDLAFYGAAPLFEEPIHVGRPNIGDRANFLGRVEQILDDKWLTNDGPMLREFESRVASHHDVEHCIAMCNGTIALEIAIRALELKGEVIIPSYTFVATAHALYWQEITPVFADIDPITHSLDPESVKAMITPRTTGIIGVHLWGRGSAQEALRKIADENNLKLMFDAAHAFGCSIGGTMVGNFGACEVLSFHATKFFNTFEGGAVLTNDKNLADKMRLMRNFGFDGYDNVIYPGTNGKMIEVCAAMGLTNLDNVERVVETNLTNYKAYQKAISEISGLNLFAYDETERNNYQYIVLEVDESFPVSRDDIVKILHAENILARKYFWPGCHRMKPYKDLFPHAGLTLPNTQLVSNKVIVLPSGTAISNSHIKCITDLLQFLSHSS